MRHPTEVDVLKNRHAPPSPNVNRPGVYFHGSTDGCSHIAAEGDQLVARVVALEEAFGAKAVGIGIERATSTALAQSSA